MAKTVDRNSDLRSMTGFARVDGKTGALAWHWEARSVNGRGLDVRVRLPPGLDAMEPTARDRAQSRLTRGNVSLTLTTKRAGGVREVRLNEGVLQQVVTAAETARRITGGAPAGLEALLQIEGVLEYGDLEEDAAESEGRQGELSKGLDDALARLIEARTQEGARLAIVLRDQLDRIEALVRAVTALPARTAEAIGARLREQVARLLEQTSALDPQRLHQEAALLATRADVTEELERLAAHVDAARGLLRAGGPVGRRLDFLTQELNREANTLCSKANDIEMTRLGLELKAVVDQMREQVQNIE